jgi:hypothetical protein
MSKLSAIVLFSVGLLLVVVRLFLDRASQNEAKHQATMISRFAPKNMQTPVPRSPGQHHLTPSSEAERIQDLEELGRLPENATERDWKLARQTKWWGKPLEPQTFWANRTVWCDRSALALANAHGRVWPPIPYEDPSLPAYPEDDGIHGQGFGVEGTGIDAASSSKEAAFWNKFIRTHPHPPEDLKQAQLDVAQRSLGTMKLIQDFEALRPATTAVTPELSEANESLKRQYVAIGYPLEAFSDDALFWTYVLEKRQNYNNLIDGGQTADSPEIKVLLNDLAVDSRYIVQPLTSNDLSSAITWKLSYLKRLNREKTDDSYINAYLDVWKVSADAVSAGTN